MDGERLIFLLGLPRSGTTLLSALLGNHPAVAAPPEPWLMLALHQIGQVPLRHPANAQVLGTAVRQFAAGAAPDADAAAGLAAAARAAGGALYDAWLRREGRTHFLDKTPRYHLIADFLLQAFPRARFIWLLRDPLDVAASHLSTWGQDVARMIAEGTDDPAVFDLLIGLDALAAFHARHDGRVRVVRYEELVSAPAAQLAGLLGHLDLDAAPETVGRMMDLAGFERPGTAFGDSKIQATRSPHSRSVGSWRSVLDAGQRQVLLDALGADRLRRLGYGPTVEALAELGTRDNGEELAAHHRARAQRLLGARWLDVERVSTFGVPLPGDVQDRLRAALDGRADSPRPEPCATADRLSGLLDEAMRRTAALEAELARRDLEVAALRASTSWRVTAPLRALSSRVRWRPPS